MSATPAEIALCCGPKCYRGSPGAGPCAAAVFGRSIARRTKDAGFVVVPREMPDDLSSAGLWRAVVAAMEGRAPSHTIPSSSQTRPDDAVTHAEVERLRLAGESLLLEACHMAAQLSHRGLPGVKGDSVDQAIESMRAALAREAPDAE